MSNKFTFFDLLDLLAILILAGAVIIWMTLS